MEQYLLTPQKKLKLALYDGRKLFAAGEGDGAVREFVRARALARVVHGDQHWRYCRCKVFLAKTYLYLKVSLGELLEKKYNDYVTREEMKMVM